MTVVLLQSIKRIGLLWVLLEALNACSSLPQPVSPNEWAKAARLGDLQALEDIGKNEKRKITDFQSPHGTTALMIAGRHGQTTLVTALLNQGADANQADHDGQTALEYTLSSSLSKDSKKIILRMLLQKGADPFRMNRLGTAPLLDMIKLGFIDEIKELSFSQDKPCDKINLPSSEDSIVAFATQHSQPVIAADLRKKGCR